MSGWISCDSKAHKPRSRRRWIRRSHNSTNTGEGHRSDKCHPEAIAAKLSLHMQQPLPAREPRATPASFTKRRFKPTPDTSHGHTPLVARGGKLGCLSSEIGGSSAERRQHQPRCTEVTKDGREVSHYGRGGEVLTPRLIW